MRIRVKLSSLLTFVLATALGATLFWVSQQVQQLESEQYRLSEESLSETEGLRVLHAEWDYLNRPDRIEALASRYLNGMTTVTPDNLLVDARAVPEPQMMQGEDEAPVLVSTQEEVKAVPALKVAEPAARPIRDMEDSKSSNFDGVLKSTAGSDE
jgi:hypothetical protein